MAPRQGETQAQDQQPPCRLLQLSTELRTYIFELCVIDTAKYINVELARRPNRYGELANKFKWLARPPKEPAITCVSRKIRDEALPIYYGQNFFKIPTTLDHPILTSHGRMQILRSYEKHLCDRVKLVGGLMIHVEARTAIARCMYVVGARFQRDGEIQIGYQEYDNKNSGTHTFVRHLCKCDLVREAKKSEKEGRSGARLFAVLRRFCGRYLMVLAEYDCPKCGLPFTLALQD